MQKAQIRHLKSSILIQRETSYALAQVRDALLQVKLKAKELHFEFQCLGTKVPEISFFFYHHVTGKKGKNVVHFYNSNINIVNVRRT